MVNLIYYKNINLNNNLHIYRNTLHSLSDKTKKQNEIGAMPL